MSCEKPNHWPRRRFPKSNRFAFSKLWGPWSRAEQAADQSEISIFAITFSTSERKPISRRFPANSLKWLWNNPGGRGCGYNVQLQRKKCQRLPLVTSKKHNRKHLAPAPTAVYHRPQ